MPSRLPADNSGQWSVSGTGKRTSRRLHVRFVFVHLEKSFIGPVKPRFVTLLENIYQAVFTYALYYPRLPFVGARKNVIYYDLRLSRVYYNNTIFIRKPVLVDIEYDTYTDTH